MKIRRRKQKDDTEAITEPVQEKKQNRISQIMILKIIFTVLFVAFSAAFWVIFHLYEFRGLELSMSDTRYFNSFMQWIPLIAVIVVIFQMFLICYKRDTKRNSIILAVFLLILIYSVGYTYYFAHGINTAGIFPINDKVEGSGNYYLELKQIYNGKEHFVKLKCDKEIYDNVIIDEKVTYVCEYMWNTLTPKTGHLINFDINDYCDNRNNWMENYFKERSKNEPSKAQLNIIKGSATVVSNVAEDAGVKITLDSVTGDGFCSYYKVDVVLPEGINAGYGLSFGRESLLINDYSIGLGTEGASMMTLEDGDSTDNRYSLLLTIHLTNYPANRDYSFDNGIVRTLHLENIKTVENGKVVTLIEGQWDFGVLFTNEAKSVELISEPVNVSGYSIWNQSPYEAKVTSFVISGFAAYCEYELAPNSESKSIGISPIAVMKDGREFRLSSDGGSNYNYSYSFAVPVALDEIDYVKLTDDVILKMT